MDFFANGGAHGSVANALLESNFDVGALRPFRHTDGRNYVTLNRGGKSQCFVTNAPATLRRDEWKLLDDSVLRAARTRLRAVADVRSRGLTLTIPNGMGRTILEYQTMGDVNGATVSMDGIRKSEADRPQFDIAGLPLPIIHKDFHFTARQIAVSRNGGPPLDTTMAELSARKVAEEAEAMLVGTAAGYSYGGYTVYGYTNHPNRNTFVMDSPLGVGWTPDKTVADVLAMRSAAQADKYMGPYVLYTSPDWDLFLDSDYSNTNSNTLRERLLKINGVSSIETMDYLTGYQMLLIQMTADVVREVIGMEVITLQWESEGGMMLNFKVMCIIVPQLRPSQTGGMGIVHGNIP